MRAIDLIRKNKETVLTGEIGSLLHDIGKMHPDFIKKQSLENIKTPHHARGIDKFMTSQLIEYFKKLKVKIDTDEKTIYDMIRFHHDAKGELLKYLAICDRKDSADDKGIVRKKQSIKSTIISSPFGYPKEKIDLNCLQKRFEDLDDELAGLFKNYISGTMDLSCFRDSLINKLKTAFSHALGETRIPANDVTLWDHSYSTASLFKTALAAMVCGASLNPRNLKWRIFGICWNGEEFINRGRKIAEIKERSEIIENIKRELKRRFEDEIPMGNAVYEDLNGIYFTFPDLDVFEIEYSKELKEDVVPSEIITQFTKAEYDLSGEDIIKKDKINKKWFILDKEGNKKYLIVKSDRKNEYIVQPISPRKSKQLAKECAREALEIIYKESDSELWPFFTLSRSSGTLTIIASQLKFAFQKRKIPKTAPTLFVEKENDENRREEEVFENPEIATPAEGQDVCPICRIRPKDARKERCDICEKRREGRLDKRKDNREETIWIDEVADKNNRIALISLNFYLDEWLNGTMIGTIYSQSFEDWFYGKKEKKENNTKVLKTTIELLREVGVNETLKPIKETVCSLLDEVIRVKNSSGDKKKAAGILDTFFQDVNITKGSFDQHIKNIEERIGTSNLTRENLATYLFTQNPSPARLYRIWQETEEFFDLLIEDIRDKIYSIRWKRIKFSVNYADLESKLKQGKRVKESPYIIQIDNLEPQKLLVFHDENGEFYTVESLEKFKYGTKTGEEAIKEALKQEFKHFALEDEPDENLLQKDEKIKPDESSIETEEYYPLIEINKSPLSLRLIVPALDSIKIIELVTKLYNERFEKVIGKLPLNIKLLVAKRKFPLYVLLDAEKRMLEDKEFKKKEKMNPWGDVNGMRNDKYYGFYPTKPKRDDKKYILDDLSSLSKGKIFHLYPGYFDFDLLLGTTDRYNIYYGEGKRGCEDYKLFTGRPYYFYQISEILKLWDLLSNLPITQINFIEEMLTSKLREWKNVENGNKQDIFRKFAEATLKDAFGDKWNGLKEEAKSFLVYSVINRLLPDTIIFFKHIMKIKEEDENV